MVKLWNKPGKSGLSDLEILAEEMTKDPDVSTDSMMLLFPDRSRQQVRRQMDFFRRGVDYKGDPIDFPERVQNAPKTTLLATEDRERPYGSPTVLNPGLKEHNDEYDAAFKEMLEAPEPDVENVDDIDPFLEDLLSTVQRAMKRKEPSSIIDLANALDAGPSRIKDGIEDLKSLGYRMRVIEDHVEITAPTKTGYNPIDLAHYREGDWYEIGVTSDAHLCNQHARLDVLNSAYDFFQEQGIRVVLHAGNYIDGERNFNRNELITAPGIERQMAYFLENYPERENINTYYIDGEDHEGWYGRDIGLNVGQTVEDRARRKGRNDLHFLGMHEVDIPFWAKDGVRPAKLKLMHGGGGSCFDDQTEILTNEGWKLFKDLNRNEQVATLNRDTDVMEWQKPHHYTDDAYSGDLIHFKARSVDMLVTPNHRMWARRSPSSMRRESLVLAMPQKAHYSILDEEREWGGVTARRIAEDFSRQRWQMKRGGQAWNGNDPESIMVPFLPTRRFGSGMKHIGALAIADAAELIAWYVTEGHIDAKHKSLTICQSQRVNPENHARIVALLRRLGFDAQGRGKDNKDIRACSRELCEWLLSECGHGSREKHLPAWLKGCETETLRLVFSTMIAGDGWNNGSAYGYRSISTRLRDDFTEIATKLGFATTVSGDTVSASFVQILPTINEAPLRVAYEGRVYCVSVPNETILVRRNGKAIWSHNSYAVSYVVQKYVEAFSSGEKPSMMFMGHFHKQLFAHIRGVHTIMCASGIDQTLWMRKLKISSVVGFHVVRFKVDKLGTVSRFQVEWFPFYNVGFYKDRYTPGEVAQLVATPHDDAEWIEGIAQSISLGNR